MPKKIYILFFFLLVSSLLSAAKINKAFEALREYDYFKAKKFFYSSLKKEPLLASYGLALIYYRTDNPFHNYDSAYKYIEKSHTSLVANNKNKKRLQALTLNDSDIIHLRDSIHLKSYHYYLQKQHPLSIHVLEQFLFNQPFSLYFSNALYKRDSIAYSLAKQEKKAGVIADFIRTFPESFFISRAYKDLDYYRFSEFSATNSVLLIEKFIDSFPASDYIVTAEDKLFEIAAAQKNTELMYKYIKQFPSNSHIEFTWKSLYSFEVGNYTTAALNAFLEKYNDFPYRHTIEKELSLANTQLIPVTVKGLYGFIDTSGAFIIPPVYNGLEEFSDGMALAEKDGKFGYINKAGEVVVSFEYEDGEAFKSGRAIVKSGKDFFLIDRSGNKVTSNYDQISDFSEGLAVVKLNGLFGAIDKNGKMEIPLQYIRLGDFSEGFSFAQKNEKSGYVDRKGDPVVPFLYEWAESFKQSLARVKYNNKYGLINTKGEFVLQPVYDRIEAQEQGVYVVYKNNLYGFADSTGCLLTDVIYTNTANEKPKELTDGKWLRLITADDQNLMDKNGKRITDKDDYEEIYLPHFQLIRVSLNEKYGFINEKNKLVIKNTFHDASDFEDSLAIVQKKELRLLIDRTGTILFSIKSPNLERLSKTWFAFTNDQGMLAVCDKNGMVTFSGIQKNPEIISDRYLVVTENEMTVVFDLKQKKYIFQN